VKIVTTAAALGGAANLASEAVSKKGTKVLPALGAAQLRADRVGDGVTLVMNNTAFQISVTFAATTEVPGRVAVNGVRLAELTGALPAAAEIVIELIDRVQDEKVVSDVVVLRSARRRFNLSTLPLHGLPDDLRIDVETGGVTLPRTVARDLFAKTCFTTVSAVDPRSYLAGTLLHSVDGALIAVATDSHALTCLSVASPGTLSTDRRLIVPVDTANKLVKLLAAGKDTGDGVVLRASKTLLAVDSAGVHLVTRLVDGTFPNYEAIVPPAVDGVTVGRDDLLAALARACAVSDGRRLQLAWAEAELHLQTLDSDVLDDVVDAEVAAPGSTAVDAHRLYDLVNELSGQRLTLAANAPREPIRITIVNDASYFLVLAPINVKEAPPP
jgi:DNA polymerase III subunit beta